MLRYLCLVSLLSSVCVAEGYKGLAAYAAMNENFPCRRYLKITAQISQPVMPVVYGSFGNNWDCVQRFINQNDQNLHIVLIYLSNEVCRRHGRCFRGEIGKDLDVAEYNQLLAENPYFIKRRVSKIRDKLFYLINDNTRVILVTGLEDNYTKKAYLNLREVIESEWPYEIARNKVGANCGTVTSNDFCELHEITSTTSRRCIKNNDGTTMSAREGKRFLANCTSECEVCVFWDGHLQGITWEWQHEFVRPRVREFKLSRRNTMRYKHMFNNID